MQSSYSVGKSLSERRLRDDDYLPYCCFHIADSDRKCQYTLFIYNCRRILVDEYSLLREVEADCHFGRVNYSHRICDESIGGRCCCRYMGVALARDDDISRDSLPCTLETQ